MEDGVKGDTAKPKEAKCTGKAGWVKKSSGKFLGTYKDRFIQLEKTEIVVYENEDLQNCLERVDLENYEKCHELRSAFKKKNRLVLIRSPKCGNKVHDIKIQAQNPEEKEAWIKAISDGISRAKNKIFDEVKVDASCSLEHVTRSRPKGNQGRRPPTRIHMKEIANVSSDGILRLDLDAVDQTPNGTHQVNAEEDAPKEVIKPPMPPSKLNESLQETPEEELTPAKKVLKPPMPPSKGNKPNVPAEGDKPKEASQETEPTTPPTPPNKPKDSSEESDGTHVTPSPSESPPPPCKDPIKPPAPPSKDKKPTQSTEEGTPKSPVNTEGSEEDKLEKTPPDTQPRNTSEETVSEGDSIPSAPEAEAKTGSAMPEESVEIVTDQEVSGPAETDPKVQDTGSNSNEVVAEDHPAAAKEPCAETLKSSVHWMNSMEPSPELSKKSPGPPTPLKKKPLKPAAVGDAACNFKEGSVDVAASLETKSANGNPERVPDITDLAPGGQDLSKPEEDEAPPPKPENEGVAEVLSSGGTENLVSPERMKQEEQKSSDGGQHAHEETKDDETTKVSALNSSQVRLNKDDGTAEKQTTDGEATQKEKPVQGATRQAKLLKQAGNKRSVQPATPPLPLKLSSKGKSASLGDLLSEPTPPRSPQPIEELPRSPPGDDASELQSKVALELDNTVELLDTVSSGLKAQEGGEQGNLSPEELLMKAVEKLKKADQFLREARSLKEAGNTEKKSKRVSW
ncbi:pleckstrin homology domain-containing family O member 2 [Megalops cyprinoides]|uniref:pleckstrin homology domain-containing family O member 2 n=1 Tax=Megalops cyprinoides TaxID=118141 RepID=UPI0018653AAF|nr:pleckstrin homology domain-containing family O member 2 [Megalops cyprinoides]